MFKTRIINYNMFLLSVATISAPLYFKAAFVLSYIVNSTDKMKALNKICAAYETTVITIWHFAADVNVVIVVFT